MSYPNIPQNPMNYPIILYCPIVSCALFVSRWVVSSWKKLAIRSLAQKPRLEAPKLSSCRSCEKVWLKINDPCFNGIATPEIRQVPVLPAVLALFVLIRGWELESMPRVLLNE